MRPARLLSVAIVAGTLATAIAIVIKDYLPMPSIPTASARSSSSGEAPSFGIAAPWLNSDPLEAAGLRGKVILVNFWTFTCINWLRQLPHVRAWAEKYKDQGLVVIGVHTPEFAFEHDLGHVTRATRDLGVTYPVLVDNDYAVWRAFKNQYWPALYFIDAQGRIRYQHFGEGDYERSERTIQALLAEAGRSPGDQGLSLAAARGNEMAADWKNLRSPETYLGYARARGFIAGNRRQDEPARYAGTGSPPLNGWSLGGVWTVGEEFVTNGEAPGRITFRFHARDLHLVLAPSSPGRSIRFRVTLDGKPPGGHHGIDIDTDGIGQVRDSRLYQLIRQTGDVDARIFEIEFLDPGIRAYAFTFG